MSSRAGKTLESLPRETNGGGREVSTVLQAKGIVSTHTEIATMVMLASQHCAGVVTCLCLL